MGGSITYEYIGSSGGNFQYRVTVKMFRYCAPGSSELDESIELAVYDEDPTDPNGNKNLYRTFEIFRLDTATIDLPFSDNCTPPANVCVQVGTFVEDIELPPTNGGYHLMYERCCRNGNIVNFDNPGDQGMSYYAFIPPTSIQNSSAVFADAPVPYICTSDTESILNSATDADGDVLKYSFVHPYKGYTNGGNPTPNWSWGNYNPYNWTIPLADYAPGYNFTNPFGGSGYANIDPNTGLTEYYNPNTGFYVVAVQIEEYRNNQLIGITRRDMQLIFITCPPNPPANLDPYPDSGKIVTTYNINEGDTVCIKLSYSDPGDTLSLTSSNLPPGSTLSNASGTGKVNSNFCWNTLCGQSGSYNFIVKVTDRGCPPKTTNQVFTINVNKLKNSEIIGLDTTCASKQVDYSIIGSTGSTYQWTVTNGSQTGGSNTNSIFVDWGNNSGNASIEVIETSKHGCIADKKIKNVYLYSLPDVRASATPDHICSSQNSTFNVSGATNFSWSLESSPSIIIGTGSSLSINSDTTVNYIVKGTDINGCINTDTLSLIVYPKPFFSTIEGPPYACPGVANVDYFIKDTSGSGFFWSIQGGSISSGQGNDSIKINWGTTAIGKVTILPTSKFGCIGDSVYLSVNINKVVIPPAPIGTDTVCSNQRFSKTYKVKHYANGSIYNWFVDTSMGKIDLLGNDSLIITWKSFPNDTFTKIWFNEFSLTVLDTCYYTSDTLLVHIYPSPVLSDISGIFSACEKGNQIKYFIKGKSGSNFIWNIDTLVVFTGNGSENILVKWDTAGTYHIKVFEVDKNNCSSITKDTVVTIHPLPSPLSIIGPDIICSKDGIIVYSANGLPNSTFYWTVSNGTLLNGEGTSTITINAGTSGIMNIVAKETTQFSCTGDTVMKIVKRDNQQTGMVVVSDNFADDTKVEVKWNLINGQYFNGIYTLLRRIPPNDNWQLIATLSEDTFIDAVLTQSYIYEYMVTVINSCGETVNSDIQNNILLLGTVDQTEKSMNIYWNKFINWPSGVKEYEIWRKKDDGTFVKESTTTNTKMEFTDGNTGFKFTYRIKAIENGGSNISWSNELEFDIEHQVVIATAYTPNGDGVNDKWIIVDIERYPNAKVEIFNRWGAKIFSSTNGYNNDWDGTFSGNHLPDGTYFYIVDLKKENLKPFTGTVTILR